jgi:hypothetical protein
MIVRYVENPTYENSDNTNEVPNHNAASSGCGVHFPKKYIKMSVLDDAMTEPMTSMNRIIQGLR